MKHILPFLLPYKKKLALGGLLVALSTICELLLPTIMSDILNHGVYEKDFPYIVRCCGIMFVVAAIGLTAVLLGWKVSSFVVAKFNGDLREKMFLLVNNMTFDEFNRFGTAALVTRSTHDIGTVSWVASMLSGSIVSIPVLFLGGVILSLRKDAVLSLILLSFVPLVLLIVLLVGRKIAPMWKTSDEYIDKQNDIMRERLHGIRVIRAFSRENSEHEKIEDATKIMATHIINANVRMELVAPLATFILNVALVLIIYVGGYRMENFTSNVSGGDIFAVVQYVTLVINGVIMAGFAIVMMPHAKVAAERIGEVFAAKEMQEDNEEDDRVFAGGISLSHVTFRYDGAAEAAVSDVSMDIAPGQNVAIIGGTGSGKSTLLQLIMAFRAPTEGTISFDGVPAAQLNKKTIRKNISCVLQKTAAYTGTILHNIEMGRPGASVDEVRQAAEIAQLLPFIDSLPEGMEHVLTQSGKNLSGGQKQRLCIARAILKDAPIYLFDDSFSALDFLTEANLRRELNEKIAGKTQIVITQRITSAMSADCIFVMDKGCLVDYGTHEALLSRCKLYGEIYASQTGGARA